MKNNLKIKIILAVMFVVLGTSVFYTAQTRNYKVGDTITFMGFDYKTKKAVERTSIITDIIDQDGKKRIFVRSYGEVPSKEDLDYMVKWYDTSDPTYAKNRAEAHMRSVATEALNKEKYGR